MVFEPSAPLVSTDAQYSTAINGPSVINSVPTVSCADVSTVNVSLSYGNTNTVKPEKLSFAAVAAKSKKPSLSVFVPVSLASSSSANLISAQPTVFPLPQVSSPLSLSNLPETSTTVSQSLAVTNTISPRSSISAQ